MIYFGIVAAFFVLIYFLYPRVSIYFSESKAGSVELRPKNFSDLFKGKGYWINHKTIDQDFISSGLVGWYLASDALLSNPDFSNLKIDKPIVLMFNSSVPADQSTIENMKQSITRHRDSISAVIWQYETLCDTQEAAGCSADEIGKREGDLEKIHTFSNSLGLRFGATVNFSPQFSQRTYGITYANADKFADFIVPVIDCQKMDCDKTDWIVNGWMEDFTAASVPEVPIASMKIISSGTAPIVPQKILDKFNYLEPSPISIGYWVWQ